MVKDKGSKERENIVGEEATKVTQLPQTVEETVNMTIAQLASSTL